MAGLPQWDPKGKLLLEEIGPLMMLRLKRMVVEGTQKEFEFAAKLLMPRYMPEPKVDSAQNGTRFNVSLTASQAHMGALAEIMDRREAAKPMQMIEQVSESDQKDPVASTEADAAQAELPESADPTDDLDQHERSE